MRQCAGYYLQVPALCRRPEKRGRRATTPAASDREIITAKSLLGFPVEIVGIGIAGLLARLYKRVEQDIVPAGATHGQFPVPAMVAVIPVNVSF